MVRRGVYEVTRSFREAEATWLVALIVMTLACVPLTWELREEWPLSGYVIPLLLAMNVLSFPRLVVLEVVLAACMGESLMLITVTPLRLVGLGVVLLAAIIVTLHVRSRARLGLLPLRGDSMLVDLRDRLASQSKLPVLPSPWHGEAVMRSAGGASFSGDFIVAARTHQAQCLEVVLVDVSGKGLDAGTRSLQLSGAFGGLLGSLPTTGVPACGQRSTCCGRSGPRASRPPYICPWTSGRAASRCVRRDTHRRRSSTRVRVDGACTGRTDRSSA